MKKLAIFLGGLLGLVLVAFLTLPGFLGGQVAKRLIEVVDQDIFAQYVGLEIIDFDQGWFSSRARLGLKPAGPLGTAAALGGPGRPLTFDVELAHGPILFGEKIRLGLARFDNTAEIAMPEEWFEGAPGRFNLRTAMTLRFGGGTDLFLSSAQRTYEMIDRSAINPDEILTRFRFEWGGFTADLRMSGGAPRLSVAARFPDGLMEVTESGVTSPLHFGEVRLEGDYEMWRGYPAFGAGSLAWEGLDFDIRDPAVQIELAMRRLVLAAEMQRAAGEVTYLSRIALEGFLFDPPQTDRIEIESLQGSLEVSGVKEATYGDLIELQARAPLAMAGMIPGGDFSRRSKDLTNRVFAEGFSFEVPALDLVMGPGSLHYDHRFGVPPGRIADLDDPAAVRAIDYEADLWVDRELAVWLAKFAVSFTSGMFGSAAPEEELRRQAEQMVEGWISEAYFSPRGGRLETRLLLRDGKFSVGRKLVEDLSRP